MQFSYQLEHNTVSDAVHSMWFASMVFSIATAVNSLLRLTWKQAMPMLAAHQGIRCPAACFSIGLCCFAYASHQSFITATLATKWLSDVLIESIEQFVQTPVVGWIQMVIKFLSHNIEKTWAVLLSLYKWLRNIFSLSKLNNEGNNLEANGVPTTSNSSPNHLPSHLEPSNPIKLGMSSISLPELTESLKPTHIIPPSAPLNPPIEKDSPSPEASPISPRKQLWQKAFQNMKMQNHLTTSSGYPGPYDRKKAIIESVTALKSWISTLVPKLAALEATQDLAEHNTLVHHLEFSPDGRFLASSSWDKTSTFF
ncbi:G-protein beta WD-40 repeat [Laccaria bicolor S238N-H82]|uniref:G-protein beta WD-40 repeat n=1 Tax=Laccaria bicolor (strain S238N-H82 / ATCC MYA-4686) TaxID=486041 RepID=B0DP01_LACBS|nr:G-protein beta WD-40 repeat [Laccaria bicolor S238N-H82]EDR03737.1 G-protein beta WD-40 repeat [Laccaria bicolor S238N-H82]|eukprot:XP_001885590.1 G-protein beta WD-40 repeat [Laccaria bicolor S238N-H82]